MNPALSAIPIWICVFLIIAAAERRRKAIRYHIQNRKGGIAMEEIIKRYIGQNVRITLVTSDGDETGVITSYNDGWITFTTKKGENAVNCEYIVKIRAIPAKH